MSQILIIMMMSLNSMLFIKMLHPMMMGITLLIQTLMTCLLIGFMSQTTWFSYILFLVFIGGMLVLFIYMTSIASNEIFQKSNYPMMIIMNTFMLMMLVVILFMDIIPTSLNNTAESMEYMDMYKNHESLMLLNLYNSPNAILTIFMVLYLFLTLIVIVFITKFHQGPLRPSI
uniref:NADH dehydrogenase subunit 6 n=1 Tax=Davidius fruhstorferi TaxID=638472 RepID=UPI0023F07D48|nr:NADH dehydrogenase subunit 6 [Davidius fruhstorferi]WDY83504.1 NADH dehydrogenase subunit 6 [Davidius fruhstorferi]